MLCKVDGGILCLLYSICIIVHIFFVFYILSRCYQFVFTQTIYKVFVFIIFG